MRTLKLIISYDGAAYAGWQYQPDRQTVQQTLEAALRSVTGETIRVLASGRTDAGVHALGQVVGFSTNCALPPEVFLRALNANLPDDIAVLDVSEAPADFHAISHARRKRYRYLIHDGPVRQVFLRNYVWHYIHGRLNEAAMARAAEPLLGTHDLRSFQSSGAERETTVRTVFELSVRRGGDASGQWPVASGQRRERGEGRGEREGERDESIHYQSPTALTLTLSQRERGLYSESPNPESPNPESPNHESPNHESPLIIIEVEADGFLYNMVRAIVGTLVEVGRGRRPESWPAEVLAAADRRRAGPTAPPQGLFLVEVRY
jgi:tRNA pseudouridine38-40 synthase